MAEHVSLSIFDHDLLKVCDIYDSSSLSKGQAYDIVYTEELSGWKEISFVLPFIVGKSENFRWNFIRNEYKLRMRIDDYEDWFIVQAPNRKKNGKSVTNTVKCNHVCSTLKTKNLYYVFDDTNGIGKIDYLIKNALTNTTWSLGECDTFFERDGVTEKIRSISSDGKKGAYQLVADICNLFNAYPTYHGATKTVDIHALDNRLPLKEMYVGKNLDSLTVESNSNNLVTRLYVEGEYGDDGYVGIDDVNEGLEGLPFLLNFDYYRKIGLFRTAHENALQQYIQDIKAVKAETKQVSTQLLENEDTLNVLWGQIPYVLLCLQGGQVKKTYYGGNILEDQKAIVAGDEIIIMPTTGDYRTYTVPPGGPVFYTGDEYAVKFVVLPNGKIGARQVAAEAGIGDLEYKSDDGLTLETAMRQALQAAERIGDLQVEMLGLTDQQTEIEGVFADAMGDMLRDGYWSNTNYAIGQEQLLYWDALDKIAEVSQPKVKYGINLVVLSRELGYDKNEFRLNTKIHLLDEETDVNDIVYVSKRSLCLDQPRKDRVEISNEGLVSSVNSFEQVLGRMTQLADIVDQKSTLYDRAKAISSQGTIASRTIGDNSVTIQKLAPEVQNLLGVVDTSTYKYGNSLLKPFDFTEKTAVFFGDDVMYGAMSTSASSAPTYCTNNWVKLFGDKFTMTYTNNAAQNENVSMTYEKVAAYTTAADYIFIGVGNTDWWNGTRIGTLGSTSGSSFYGCLELMCEALEANQPSATVIFVTPINQPRQNAAQAASLNAYRNAIFETAAMHGYNVVDGTKTGFPADPNSSFKPVMIPDGIHPSELGYSMMYKSMCGILL